jgi:hypothetical protein
VCQRRAKGRGAVLNNLNRSRHQSDAMISAGGSLLHE